MTSARTSRVAAVLSALVLVASACGGECDDGARAPRAGSSGTAPAEEIDHTALGLWDDGPCDPARPPLVIGMMTVFESGVISLRDQAIALEVAAAAFNERGGANGACIEVHTCDDGANLDQSLECVREVDEAGVVATVNDQGTVGAAEVSAAMSDAGIPRIASLVTPDDWADPNTYPLDAAGTGVIFMLPQALIDQDVTELGAIRVSLAQAAALVGLLEGIYADQGATFRYDGPVPAGTTDFTQFILGAQAAGAEGVVLALGEQEAVQIVKAGEQLDTQLLMGSSLGTFSHSNISGLGDFAERMVFVGSNPPATADVPVFEALRSDLASTGEEVLQPGNLEGSAMRSWIGLYALLRMIRDAQMTEFTREGIAAMLDAAEDVPMLGMYGGEDWTPALDHPGAFARAGINTWGSWRWDPEADAPDGLEGNFVPVSTIDFDEVMCGSPLGAPESTCGG